ncbi:MAG: hypothetical protein BroJett011_38470 [Chloroflexota bacterium]|nr:MAG: hypothetical protein BroJett011_38470 [Chloroflexota bacterium]
MRLTYRTTRFTYKSLFGYSLVVIALLLVAVPVFATTNAGVNLLDFSRSLEVNNSPQTAYPLTKGVNVNHLNPGEEDWYTYSRASFDDPSLSWISLAMRFESEAIISPQQANFEILTQPEADSWFQQPATPTDVQGTGLTSPLKAANQNLNAMFWTGEVADQEVYYVRVFNQSPFGLNYTLEAKAEQPAVSGATPASLNSAISEAEALSARQLSWSLTAQAVGKMNADEAAQWMQQAQAVGWIVTAGTAIPDAPQPSEADPNLLWHLTAEAIAGLDAEAAAHWLNQADSLGWLSIPLNTLKNPALDLTPTETGGEGSGDGEGNVQPAPAVPAPPPEIYTPVNIYPNNPLEFNTQQVNSGRLAPYGEHWYSLLRDDLDQNKIEDMALTMFSTPSDGFIDSRVNFEIFPAGQYHIWARGDADYMENIGLGQWLSRDKDDHTGERLWKGSLVDGDRYLIKVENNSPEVVDYYLFPGDIQNAELGNPTLHQGDGTAGRIPYNPSPPTRPSLPAVPGAAPPDAIDLKMGVTQGKLKAGQEIWYKFYYRDAYNETTPQHDFKIFLTNTPFDEIRARHADFALYAGNQLQIWTRGTVDKLEPFGVSMPSPYPTEDIRSLQVLWDGQLMEEHVYYLKIWNHDIGSLKYELEVQGGP